MDDTSLSLTHWRRRCKEYFTCGGGWVRCRSLMLWIHLSISPGLSWAFSIDLTMLMRKGKEECFLCSLTIIARSRNGHDVIQYVFIEDRYVTSTIQNHKKCDNGAYIHVGCPHQARDNNISSEQSRQIRCYPSHILVRYRRCQTTDG